MSPCQARISNYRQVARLSPTPNQVTDRTPPLERMTIKKTMLLALAALAFGVAAQDTPESEWQETQVPAPPAFNTDRLVALEMPPYVSMRFGIDPATLTITRDGVVRYVVVATNSTGSYSAMYEGIRCATGEVKVYARSSAAGSWNTVKDPQWQALNSTVSKHAMILAKEAACADGTSSTARSVDAIVNALKSRY